MRMIPLAVLATALAVAVAAGAQEKKTPFREDPRTAHAETDKNKDGFIDRDEFHVRDRLAAVLGELLVVDEEAYEIEEERLDHEGEGIREEREPVAQRDDQVAPCEGGKLHCLARDSLPKHLFSMQLLGARPARATGPGGR